MSTGLGFCHCALATGALVVTADVSGDDAKIGCDSPAAASAKESVATTQLLLSTSSGTPSGISSGQTFDNVDRFGGDVDMHFDVSGDGGTIDLGGGGRCGGDNFLASLDSTLAIGNTTDIDMLTDEDFEAIFDANMGGVDLATIVLPTDSQPPPSDSTSMLISSTTTGIGGIQNGHSGCNMNAVPPKSPGSDLSRFACRKIKGRVPQDGAIATTANTSSMRATVTESTMVRQSIAASRISLSANSLYPKVENCSPSLQAVSVLVASTTPTDDTLRPSGGSGGIPLRVANDISNSPHITSPSSLRPCPAHVKSSLAAFKVVRPSGGEVDIVRPTIATHDDSSYKDNVPPDSVDEHLDEKDFKEIISQFRGDLCHSSYSLESSSVAFLDGEVDLSKTLSQQALSYEGDFMDLEGYTEGLDMLVDDILQGIIIM